MKKRTKLSGILISIMALSGCSDTASFNGSRIGNDSKLIMEYSLFDTTDKQELTLKKGDVIDVDVKSTAGEISAVIQKDNEQAIYKGESIPTSAYQLEVEEDGIYLVMLTGKKAEGSISIKKANQ